MTISHAVERETAAGSTERQRREPAANPFAVEHVLALQRLAGNAAVCCLVRSGQNRSVRSLQRDTKEEREAERAYYESTRQVRQENAAKANDEWWRANLLGGDGTEIDALWRGGHKAALFQAITTPGHGLKARQVVRIWTLYWADKYNAVNNLVSDMGICARHVPPDKCDEYQRQHSQAAAMLSAVVDVHGLLIAADGHKKSLTLDEINKYARWAGFGRAIVGMAVGLRGGPRSYRPPPPGGGPKGTVGGKSPPKTPPPRQPIVVTPKTPPPARQTMVNATTTGIGQLKNEGFVLQRVTPDGRTAVYQKKTSGELVDVTLRQGGPAWVNPAWGRSRVESELRSRGFILLRPTRGEGGLIYQNTTTGAQMRVMPKPDQQFRDEPIEKHLGLSYYRYREHGAAGWGDHTMIRNTK